MTRTTRLALFAVAAAGIAVLLGAAFADLPSFGAARHPYRDATVTSAIAHHTANVVSSVNFDTRAIDTLGEEVILLASVVGVATLLRRAEGEHQRRGASGGRVLELTKFGGYQMLGVTLLIGFDVVAHGHVTPGGGFQGGVVLATGFHLLYVAGRYGALERLRPLPAFELGEAAGATGFAGLGLAGLAVLGGYLANLWPGGSFGQLLSAGTVPLLNIAVGIEVASGVVVLLAKFLEQAIAITDGGVE
ncbi:MAG TPA: MnhB domain-containing protein [Acidimicrobiales bacterium]|nr:MnhB domain-containing protein [Acidimicrobiales bacterium]